MAAVGSVERAASRNVHMVQASPAADRPYGAYHFDRVQAPRHVITDERERQPCLGARTLCTGCLPTVALFSSSLVHRRPAATLSMFRDFTQ